MVYRIRVLCAAIAIIIASSANTYAFEYREPVTVVERAVDECFSYIMFGAYSRYRQCINNFYEREKKRLDKPESPCYNGLNKMRDGNHDDNSEIQRHKKSYLQ